jgi:hypothetical protein
VASQLGLNKVSTAESMVIKESRIDRKMGKLFFVMLVEDALCIG